MNIALAVLIVGTFVIPSAVRAEPLRITSGTISIGSDLTGGLEGEGFTSLYFSADVHEQFGNTLLPRCCEPGSTSTFAGSGRWGFLHPILDSTHFDSGLLAFAFTSPAFVYPEIPYEPDKITIVQPFSFAATLSLYDPFPDEVLRRELVGSGHASMSVTKFRVPPGEYEPACSYIDCAGQSLRYTFESSAPVPEPGTFVLIGIAAAGFGARRLWKRTGA
jgi:hypothetical protein